MRQLQPIRTAAPIRGSIEVTSLLLVGLVVAACLALSQSTPAPAEAFRAPLPDTLRLEHAANRLTFGATPGTLDAIRTMGLEQWIEQQLFPERIRENPKLRQALQAYPALSMSSAQLAREYPNRQYLRAVANGRASLPDNPQQRQKVQAMAKVYADRERQFVQQMPNGDQPASSPTAPSADLSAMNQLERLIALAGMTREERQQSLRQLPASERRELMESIRPAFTVQSSLVAGKLLRATYSERQLQELLTDFWFNHFNISVQKEGDRYYAIPYERDVIRKHALGRFEHLLVATAQSPAMLFYLDNFQSISPDARLPRRIANSPRAPKGLNENYARELMELHTLGVDGGYTQNDVTEVARCFTGWTIDARTPGGGFRFVPRLHDNKPKTVLGNKIKTGGMKDGLKVLSILANHPSTARSISTKLAVRFVADNPPPSLVDAMSATFLRTQGDIREVMRTMLQSDEFWSQGAYRAKVKQPFEMAVSAVRALNADLAQPLRLARALDRLGQPLYRKQEPTGYPAENSEWINSAALVERMNLALTLASNRIPGLRYELPANSGQQVVDLARTNWLLPVSDDTVASIAKAIDDPDMPQLRQFRGAREAHLWAGLLLGSPDFQRK